MICATESPSSPSLLAMLVLPGSAAWPEDRIRRPNIGTAATNVAGVAAVAVVGFGCFTWDDNSDAKETLAELGDIRIALAEGARKKGCRL